MFFSRLSVVVGLSFVLDLVNVVCGYHCPGCSNNPVDCVELVEDGIYGCYGTYLGPIVPDAQALCSDGYHVCESANEAEVLGLQDWTCGNTVPSGHYFWSYETSQYSSNVGECYSNYGDVSGNTPTNDIWGCASSDLDISICGNERHRSCGPLNKQCDSSSLSGIVGYTYEQGIGLCENCGGEIFTMKVTDSSRGGILCCSDKIPTDLTSGGCDESITVYSIEKTGGPGSSPNFAPFVGKYKYYGNNEYGRPRYVHHPSNAEITVSNFMTSDLVLKIILPNYGIFFSSAINEEQGVITDAGYHRFEITEDFWSEAGSDIHGNGIDFVVHGASIGVTATFSDCPNYGLENVNLDETPGPITCPNYDSSQQANCYGYDFHCYDCQPWGCNQCKHGFYKMGNLQKCESCSMNYPHCAKCNDWQGCVECNNGYSLQWDATCQDEICV